ncbi:MAG: L,D-transpeptidase [Coriobacteriia bacterium]|nr:L,D-transpeptidase [Coriobacteriia bacterium]
MSTSTDDEAPRGKHARIDNLPKVSSSAEDPTRVISTMTDQPTQVISSSSEGAADQAADDMDGFSKVVTPEAEEYTQAMAPVDQEAAAWGAHARVDSTAAASAAPANLYWTAADDATRAFDMGDASSNKKKRRWVLPLVISLSVVVVLVLAAYIAGIIFFAGHFFPSTQLGTKDISLMSVEELESSLDVAGQDYSLNVSGFGFDLRLSNQDIQFTFNGSQTANEAIKTQNVWMWPAEVFADHDMGEALKGAYNSSAVEAQVTAAVEEHNKTAVPTQDASIDYDDVAMKYYVKPESVGTQLNAAATIKVIESAIVDAQTVLALTAAELQQPSVVSTDTRFMAAVESANSMIKADIKLCLADTVVMEVNGNVISQWIGISDDMEVTFDEEAMVAWVDELASQCDTVGGTRTWTRPDGKECEVSGGDYGWTINHDDLIWLVQEDIRSGAVTTEDIPTYSYANAFNGLGKADWGNRYIDVDLTEQHVRFYGDGGEIIWESDCISGAMTDNRATPTGVYDLNAKESPSTLIGYEDGKKIYETKVTFWMPFVGNGVGFHDATWQPDFGGDMYLRGYGSHGCVNLPYEAAEQLYGIITFNDPIVVHW